MIIDDIKKYYYSVLCKVPEKSGNKCDDCINKKKCFVTNGYITKKNYKQNGGEMNGK